MILGDKVELEFKEPICFTLSTIPSTHNRPNPALDVPRCHPPRRPYFRGLSTSSLIQPGIAVVSNWKQCDVKRGCSPEARPAVARWELNQPINQSVWPSCWHSLRGVTGGRVGMMEGRILLGLVLDAGFGAKWHPPEHFPHGVLKARDGGRHLYRAYLLQKESRLIGTRGPGILGSIPQFPRDATSTASVGAAIVVLLEHRGRGFLPK